MRKRRRSIFINGLLVIFAGFVCLWFHDKLHPEMQNAYIDLVLDSLGLSFLLFGQYIRISARGYKSERLTGKAVLITNGPYALVQHPMYLSSFLIGLGIVVLLLKPLLIIIYVLLFILWYSPQIHKEKKWLEKMYGQEYLEYCKKTPAFIPHISLLFGFKGKAYIPLKLRWIKREWNTILVWAIIVVIVEGYQDINAFSIKIFARECLFLGLLFLYFFAFAFLFREE